MSEQIARGARRARQPLPYLRAWRQRQGVTTAFLADCIGRDEAVIIDVETGCALASNALTNLLAWALDIMPETLREHSPTNPLEQEVLATGNFRAPALAEWLRVRELSQSELARRLGVSRQCVSYWVSARYRMTGATLTLRTG